MGELLRPLAELCESTGCTVLVVHHCKQARKVGDPATLEDLAGSGFAELSAQWLLVSRRRPFDPVPGQHGTGHHELWLTTGSRAGDQGLWELDVEEGVAGVEPTGEPPVFDALGAAKTPTPATRTRGWKTTLRPVTSATTAADERFVAAREDRNLRRRAMAVERQCQRLLELLTAYPDGRTARFIRDTLGMSGDRIKRVLDSLIEKGHVVRMEDRLIDARRPIVTYARVQVNDLSAAAIKAGHLPGSDPKVYDIGTGQFVDRKQSQDAGLVYVPERRRDASDRGPGAATPKGRRSRIDAAKHLRRQSRDGTWDKSRDGTRNSRTFGSRRASDGDGRKAAGEETTRIGRAAEGILAAFPFPNRRLRRRLFAERTGTTAEPSVWEKCASPTTPATTRSSEALSMRSAKARLIFIACDVPSRRRE